MRFYSNALCANLAPRDFVIKLKWRNPAHKFAFSTLNAFVTGCAGTGYRLVLLPRVAVSVSPGCQRSASAFAEQIRDGLE